MPGERSRHWTWTLNNPTEEEIDAIKKLDTKYTIFGHEVGELQNTPHLQGYMVFTNKKSLKQVKKFIPRAHLEISKGSPSQNIEYCSKEKNIWENGIRPKDRKAQAASAREKRAARNAILMSQDLMTLVTNGDVSINSVPLLKKARNILEQEYAPMEAETVRGLWLYGPPGLGKSHYARTEFKDSLYLKMQNKWFDGYTGQKNILLDDLDTSVLGHYLKIWADKWACSGEVKHGWVPLRHEKFIITSNYLPEDLWCDDIPMQQAIRRRFKILRFVSLGNYIES